ncbi:helix-turn-helix transcriptional regulator [archaeon]|jgi:ArsR family transcriptional regulator, cadmium/lead-responsive transcriptional repressor|nr:helix-turn-helix transcriptional regulator [archaeon]MBT6182309.1 helix-turn-helix transcriptional regulator [archaeon]MBT6606292.1 helix-turn-helix transcriptional regulator [archaeon]MBT7251539.1 helix-turn-helix transcriptional regulator [archaeon]MBT7661180.1 helix-turn-helix transcriptional regulator [archaeon]
MTTKNILKKCHSQGFGESDTYGAYKIFFGTLVSESRLKIINLLRKKNLSVGQISEELGLEQTATSHDLARLKQCGFVSVETVGKYRNYSLNKETIEPLMKLIDVHMAANCIHILNNSGGNK